MDDLFAILSLVCAAAWILAATAKASPIAEGRLRNYAMAVLSWKNYFIVLFLITLFRAAFYEMFWIPSASMQPSLREGEFVLVDKNEYGIRIPLIGARVGDKGEPERGEIVVFRYPLQEDLFYIKRIIGLPGDEIELVENMVRIEGANIDYLGPAPEEYIYEEGIRGGLVGSIIDAITVNKKQVKSELHWERLPNGWHPILFTDSNVSPLLSLRHKNCKRNLGGRVFSCVVPEDSYFVMGDNRHRSNDSRFWGFVPRSHLVGACLYRRRVTRQAFKVIFITRAYRRSIADGRAFPAGAPSEVDETLGHPA